jgi:uncharacterized protein (DUF1330 family)
MSVYVTATYDIADLDGYQGYVPGVLPLLQKHGAQVLAADFGATALEGQARGVNVLLRFPSEEAARAWYNDAEYQPVKQIRLRSTASGSIVLMREFVPPAA